MGYATYFSDSLLEALGALKSTKPNPQTLKQYTGWGGLREAVYTPEIYRKLKQFLNDEQITSIKQTLTSAYYTPPELVAFIFKLLTRFNRKIKTILEPSIGHGVFIEQMPKAMRDNAQITAIEIDSISCKLVKHLYPEVKLHQSGFETYHPSQRFDLIIGNPPYGRDILDDSNHTDLAGLRIHHYFVAKCMRLLNEGGLLAMVLPRYFLDNRRDHARAIIAQEGGVLLAAYRLPDDLFDDAKVTVDVVILEKREGAKDWLYTDKKCIEGQTFFINRYFAQNPAHIIGRLSVVQAFGRNELSCKGESSDYIQQLNQLLTPQSKSQFNSLTDYKTFIQQKINKVSAELARLTREKTKLEQLATEIEQQEAALLAQLTVKFQRGV